MWVRSCIEKIVQYGIWDIEKMSEKERRKTPICGPYGVGFCVFSRETKLWLPPQCALLPGVVGIVLSVCGGRSAAQRTPLLIFREVLFFGRVFFRLALSNLRSPFFFPDLLRVCSQLSGLCEHPARDDKVCEHVDPIVCA